MTTNPTENPKTVKHGGTSNTIVAARLPLAEHPDSLGQSEWYAVTANESQPAARQPHWLDGTRIQEMSPGLSHHRHLET
jgi:hypothetical protein